MVLLYETCNSYTLSNALQTLPHKVGQEDPDSSFLSVERNVTQHLMRDRTLQEGNLIPATSSHKGNLTYNQAAHPRCARFHSKLTYLLETIWIKTECVRFDAFEERDERGRR